jgi:acetyl-CoA synthetase
MLQAVGCFNRKAKLRAVAGVLTPASVCRWGLEAGHLAEYSACMERPFDWVPTPKSICKTNLYALMEERHKATYEEVHAWSVREPAAFLERTIAALHIALRRPWERLLDVSEGPAHARWLQGAELNIAESCLNGPAKGPAIVTRRQGTQEKEKRLETVTVGELDRLSNRVANGLQGIGIGKGDAVAIDMAMTAESVAIYLGIIKGGAAAVSIADSLPAEEIARRLQIGGAKAIFTQDAILRAGKSLPMYAKVCEANAPAAIVLSGSSEALELRPGDLHWSDFLNSNDRFEAVSCAPQDTTNILFSSGTTGDPKAIPWDHTTPIKCGSDALYHHDIHPGDVVCWPTNLGWMMGPWLIYAALMNRAAIALYEGAPTERGFCKFVQEAHVTMLGLVPSIVKSWRTSGAADGLDWSRLRCYSSSGEASDPNDYAWLMRLNQPDGSTRPVIEYCGGTEIGGGYAASTMIAQHRAAEFNAVAMGSEVVFLNERSQPCAPGETGEVFLRPPSIGLSTRLLNADNDAVYYADCPVLEGRTLRRHGDQVIVGEHGRFRSDGRADDAMNLGGIKVGSVEIERTLNRLPAILETAAVAVPPPGGGPDRLVIFAVLKPQESGNSKTPLLPKEGRSGAPNTEALKREMQQAIKEHLNPLFHIEDVVITPSLPRTASNKVMRKELRRQYRADVLHT